MGDRYILTIQCPACKSVDNDTYEDASNRAEIEQLVKSFGGHI